MLTTGYEAFDLDELEVVVVNVRELHAVDTEVAEMKISTKTLCGKIGRNIFTNRAPYACAKC